MSINLHHFTIDRARFEKILDFLPYPFLIAHYKEGTYHNIYLNKKFTNEIGYHLTDMPTIDDWFTLAYPNEINRAETIASWTSQFQRAQNEGKDFAIMKVLIHTKYDESRWYEVKASVLGSIQLVAFIDIHQETIHEKELENLNQTNNITLSILSHDLRTPVIQLRSLTELVLREQLTKEEFTPLVQKVNEKSQQVLDLIDTTLLWTKSNFNQIAIRSEEVDLKKITASILSVYDIPIKEKNLSINYEISQTLKSDPEIIMILMRNLLSNAIKYTPAFETIDINLRKEEGRCIITVHNSGAFINAQMIDRLLSNTYLPDKSWRFEKGHGIGLKLCRQLVEKANGKMEIESSLITGTTFSIII